MRCFNAAFQYLLTVVNVNANARPDAPHCTQPQLPRFAAVHFLAPLLKLSALVGSAQVLRRNLEGQIARARDSTRLYLGWGNCSAVRVARTDMSAAEIGANLASAIPEVARHVPQGWRGIQALHIKTPDSVALPLYSHAREADALAAAAVEQEEAEASAAGEGNQVEDKKATKETKAKASKVVAAKKTRGSTKTRGKLAAVDEQPKKAEAMPEIAEEEAEEEQEDVEEPEKEVEPKKKRGRGRRVAELKAATPAKKNVNDKFSPRVTRSMRKKRQ